MLIKTDDNRTDLGYFMIDQRATGLLAPGSMTPLYEAATYTCKHCERVVVMEPARTRPRYKCGGCSHLICDPCAAEKFASGGACRTYQQRLDESLDAEERATSIIGTTDPTAINSILTQETRQSGVGGTGQTPLILASS